MSSTTDSVVHQPKADHDRRLALGLDPRTVAEAAGISVDQLTDYEGTWPTYAFDAEVAMRVKEALHRLEADRAQ